MVTIAEANDGAVNPPESSPILDSVALTISLITLLVVSIVVIIVLVLCLRVRRRTKTGFFQLIIGAGGFQPDVNLSSSVS